MSAAELAAQWGVAPRTLASWAKRGYGPRRFQLGPRTARYDRDEVRRWLADLGSEAQPPANRDAG